MSKARVVVMSVVVEGHSQADTARIYGVSPGWVSKLVARYHQEGDAAFEPRSRRPKTSPNALDPSTVGLIIELRQSLTADGLDSGAHTIRWHLKQQHGLVVSAATIWRHLQVAGLVTPQPKKRPKSRMSDSKPIYRTRCDNPISLTGVSPMDLILRSSPSLMTTVAMPSR